MNSVTAGEPTGTQPDFDHLGKSKPASKEMSAAAAVIRTYCDAWLAGDAMAVLGLYHQDLTLYWPGQHKFAGVHKGQAAAIDALLGLQAVTNRKPLQVLDIMTGQSTIMIKVLEGWSLVEGDIERSVELVRVLEYTVEEGQLHTCRIYESDQPAIDAWLGSVNDSTSS